MTDDEAKRLRELAARFESLVVCVEGSPPRAFAPCREILALLTERDTLRDQLRASEAAWLRDPRSSPSDEARFWAMGFAEVIANRQGILDGSTRPEAAK